MVAVTEPLLLLLLRWRLLLLLLWRWRQPLLLRLRLAATASGVGTAWVMRTAPTARAAIGPAAYRREGGAGDPAADRGKGGGEVLQPAVQPAVQPALRKVEEARGPATGPHKVGTMALGRAVVDLLPTILCLMLRRQQPGEKKELGKASGKRILFLQPPPQQQGGGGERMGRRVRPYQTSGRPAGEETPAH